MNIRKILNRMGIYKQRPPAEPVQTAHQFYLPNPNIDDELVQINVHLPNRRVSRRIYKQGQLVNYMQHVGVNAEEIIVSLAEESPKFNKDLQKCAKISITTSQHQDRPYSGRKLAKVILGISVFLILLTILYT